MKQPRHTAKTMARAHELREAGWSYRKVAEHLTRETGLPIHHFTVQLWTNEQTAANHRSRGLRMHAKSNAAKAMFRLPGNTPEYRLAFMQRLADEGVGARAIGCVYGVVFGETLTLDQVRWALAPAQRGLKEQAA